MPPSEARYDVIVIGAGVGGLTAAAMLSAAGLKVAVLESSSIPGGYLQGFRRKDFRFDTAIHWLNQYGPEGLITKIFSALGNDFPKARVQREIRRYKGEGYEYLLTSTPDDLKKQWQQEFSEDKEGIERFFKAAQKIGRAFSAYGYPLRSEETMGFLEALSKKGALLKFAMAFIPHLRYSGEKGIDKGLRKYFSSERLRKVFASDTELLSCLVPIGWAYGTDFQSPPVGGGQRIPEWLAHIAASHGAELAYKCPVQGILTDEGRAVGVAYEHRGLRHEARASWVIAACDLTQLYEKMLPAESIPPKVLKRLHNAELYSSSLTLSIALDCPTGELGFGEEMIHLTAADAPYGAHQGSDPALSEVSILAPSLRDPSLAPEGCGTLTLYMPALMTAHNNWSSKADSNGNPERGEEYKATKNAVAEQLIDRVAKAIAPQLREHILFYEVATPITHWRYTGNRGGTMMGAKPGRANMQNKVARYHTPVKHLILGGHWAELGGGVPIAVKAGTNAALIILKEELPRTFTTLAAYIDGKQPLEQLLASGVLLPGPNDWVPKPTPAEEKAAREAAE